MDTEFEEKLMDMISEYQRKGMSSDEIISVLELRIMALNEESDPHE